MHVCCIGGVRHSYVAMISEAIFSSANNQLPLVDIYAFIGSVFFRHKDVDDSRVWRNNVRHHLSVNDCFVKVGGRQSRGRGSFWAIHPDCIDDFRRGDYRRRRWTVRGNPRSHTKSAEACEGYEPMEQTISPSDELFVHLVSSGVFARLACMHSRLL